MEVSETKQSPETHPWICEDSVSGLDGILKPRKKTKFQ